MPFLPSLDSVGFFSKHAILCLSERGEFLLEKICSAQWNVRLGKGSECNSKSLNEAFVYIKNPKYKKARYEYGKKEEDRGSPNL